MVPPLLKGLSIKLIVLTVLLIVGSDSYLLKLIVH